MDELEQYDDNILTAVQIEKFRAIFNKYSNIEENFEENEATQHNKIEELLNQQEEAAFLNILQTKFCCKSECFKNKINHVKALQTFQDIKSLSKTDSIMFFFRVIQTMKRSSNDNIERKNFTLKYIFEEIEICESAFLKIHLLGIKRWKNIRNHYQANGIKLIIHENKRRRSHNALSFETILYVITFIVNYANIHGLPSPDII